MRTSHADALLKALHANVVLRSGSEEALTVLIEQATRLEYPAGRFLFRQGDPAAHVYVLATGEVAMVSSIRDGSQQVLAIVGPGDLIGELALLLNGPQLTGARAITPTVVWAIAQDAFWKFLELTPATSALLREVAAQVAAREALIDDLLTLDMKGRLARAMLRLAEQFGSPGPTGTTRISLPLTHRDLASMVGGSREHVSRILASFRKDEFINYDAEAILLLNPDALRRLA